MKRNIPHLVTACVLAMLCGGDASGRGFGGFRGGSFSGFSGGGFRYGGGGGWDHSFNYSGSRSFDSYSGWRGGVGGTSSFDRSWTGSRGGSIDTSGTRGAAVGPRGGVAAGGSRDTTVTGPDGRSYSSDRSGGAAVGPYGRTIGGAEGTRTASGPGGTASSGWRGAYAGTRFPTDAGLGRYSSFGVAAGAHTTTYWSHGYMNTRAGYVRTGFGYYGCFTPNWYSAHPGAWFAAGWAAGVAWTAPPWASICGYWGIPETPIVYNFGDNVIVQDNDVYVDGQETTTAPQFAQQAITLADDGQKAKATPEEDWKALGVFALVQGDEKTSNNIFQLAVNKQGVIRGNYYDGLMDTTTPVYGSVDKKTQRAAWTIGKKNDRIFDAGIYNLTQSETPVLVHFGADQTQQWLLVRVEKPKDSK